jgi:hypothetical protein
MKKRTQRKKGGFSPYTQDSSAQGTSAYGLSAYGGTDNQQAMPGTNVISVNYPQLTGGRRIKKSKTVKKSLKKNRKYK